MSPGFLDTYPGDFTNDYFGDCSVTIDVERLVLHIGLARAPYPMRHFDHHVFLYQPVGEYAGSESAVTFTVGPDGLAASLLIENLDVSHYGTFVRA